MTTSIANADAGGAPNTSTKEGSGKAGPMLALAICLAALAGWVDATGYIHFHHLFVSFMSGNSTHAAVAATRLDTAEMLQLGRTILVFVTGVIVGELCGAISERWGRTVVLIFEMAMLGGTALAAQMTVGEAYLSSMLGFAMGLQNATVHRAGEISLALTYVTGTLVHIGRAIAGALRGAAPWRAALPFVGLWVGLVCGGFCGALVAERSLIAALVGGAVIGAALTVWSLVATVLAERDGLKRF